MPKVPIIVLQESRMIGIIIKVSWLNRNFDIIL
jgi:hypothetical protein